MHVPTTQEILFASRSHAGDSHSCKPNLLPPLAGELLLQVCFTTTVYNCTNRAGVCSHHTLCAGVSPPVADPVHVAEQHGFEDRP